MDIKIPSESFKGDAIDALKDTSEVDAAPASAPEIQNPQAAQAGSSDPVSQIADQVYRGEISRKEAVDSILREVMGDGITAVAPPEIRKEIEEVLSALLETHPTLRSLTAALGD